MTGRFLARFLVVFLLLTGVGFSQDFVGTIDGYYGYNLNKPPSGKNLYHNFDFNHNQFSLNYAEIAIELKPGPVGFRADIGFGDAATAVHAGEPAGPDIYRYLQQAYLSAAKGKVQVDFGKFVTQHGAEVIETKDNWNYTRSLLFAWAIPYYHFGTRLTATASDKVTLGVNVSNGWNNVVDNNQGKTVGLMAIVKPVSQLTWASNYMVGREKAGDNGVRNLFDTTVTLEASPKVSLMANYDYGMDRLARSRVLWQGIAVYARFTPVSRFKFSPRLEYFNDSAGFATGTAQKLKEGTLTAEFGVAEGMFLRGEYRRDWSDTKVFEKKTGGTRTDQDTLTIGVVYTFTKTK